MNCISDSKRVRHVVLIESGDIGSHLAQQCDQFGLSSAVQRRRGQACNGQSCTACDGCKVLHRKVLSRLLLMATLPAGVREKKEQWP